MHIICCIFRNSVRSVNQDQIVNTVWFSLNMTEPCKAFAINSRKLQKFPFILFDYGPQAENIFHSVWFEFLIQFLSGKDSFEMFSMTR